MNILGVITARGGSKRLPGKNLKALMGKPLLVYTIEAALESKLLTRVILSSNDDEAIELAKRYGIEVPFKRPAELAGDETPHVDVMVHAVKYLEEKECFFPDVAVVLQPTSPLRTAEDIDSALKIHMETDADSVVSVVRTEHWHPVRAKKIENDILVDYALEDKVLVANRDLTPAYFRNGAFYSVKRDVLINEHSLYGRVTRPYVMPPERSVDIDTGMDFKLAGLLLKERERR